MRLCCALATIATLRASSSARYLVSSHSSPAKSFRAIFIGPSFRLTALELLSSHRDIKLSAPGNLF
ncbi:hypothetical protein CC86DRAFT_365641 [Ophiobolus disseminans]|uniref:Uncharacterized protein n=1 Tax=Ophiobolus disseminans TaxID=1469910 RepID=A0A6A7AMR4_9PLEO|nr:hypothetical protein CC86DRAFT_365641 [Ophiobolus disseminans]